MTNSDYLLKAAIKKVTEKLNELLVEKIEESLCYLDNSDFTFNKFMDR